MTVKAQIFEMLNLIPDGELSVILEVVKRFVPIDFEDVVTADDIDAHNAAMKEYETGETIAHNSINWT